jgi:Fuseless
VKCSSTVETKSRKRRGESSKLFSIACLDSKLKVVTSNMSKTSDGPFDNHVLYQSLSVLAPLNPPPWKKRFMNAIDSFFSLFVISPLVISHWRGTWEFMNLFPRYFPGVNCMIFGAIIHCCLAILREPLHARYNTIKRLQTNSRSKTFNLYIVKKIYTYVFSIGCIMHW